MKKPPTPLIVIAALAATMLFPTLPAEARTPKPDRLKANIGADLVSGYVWRGVYQAGSGISIQPSLGIEYKGFGIGAWGSTSLTGGFKELDLCVGYETHGFAIRATDYWWAGQGAPFYSRYLDSHLIEGALSYRFGDKTPLSLEWHTFFAGNLDKDATEKRQYSSYLQIAYDFEIKGIECTAAVGAAPWNAPAWLPSQDGKKGFRISNISLTAARKIRITDRYSPPVFVQAVASPATDDANLIFGISF